MGTGMYAMGMGKCGSKGVGVMADSCSCGGGSSVGLHPCRLVVVVATGT